MQIHACADLLGHDHFLHEPADCWAYGYDNSRRHALPDGVAFPVTHAQVEALVRYCNREHISLIPRGRGTGTTGATVPEHGGVVLSLERMNKIITVDAANRAMVTEPGVTNLAVQDAAAEHGFFWPPDPTSAAYCSVGGNLAYNSAGPRSIKYGTPRENVLGLRAVTGSGESLRTGVYTTKGVVGYDLTRLLIGSEGTLAIITEATLKLTPLPASKRTMQVFFAELAAATRAIAQIMAQPVIPCALEFVDGAAIEMIRGYTETVLPAGAAALLMIEVDGPEAAMEDAVNQIDKATDLPGRQSFSVAATTEEVSALWATRKALSPALRKIAPKKINEDVVVPVSRITDLIGGLGALSERHGITIVNFGHAGNGNIHVNLLVNPDDAGQMRRAERCLDQVFDLVLSLDGTLSGEHGIGIEKREFISKEIDPVALDLMRKIKTQFDPKGILNPGKMFPPR